MSGTSVNLTDRRSSSVELLHDCGDEWRETMKMKQDRGIVTKGKATYHLERAIFMRFDRVSQVHTFRRFRDGDMR